MEMFINLIMVPLVYTCVHTHQIVHMKQMQFFVYHTTVKLF